MQVGVPGESHLNPNVSLSMSGLCLSVCVFVCLFVCLLVEVACVCMHVCVWGASLRGCLFMRSCVCVIVFAVGCWFGRACLCSFVQVNALTTERVRESTLFVLKI